MRDAHLAHLRARNLRPTYIDARRQLLVRLAAFVPLADATITDLKGIIAEARETLAETETATA